jgi:ketosteroid isomerase-like protein
VLESLSPEQRAVLLLHDVFGYRYDEVAAIVGKEEANVRQLAVRARRHVEERRPRFTTTPEQQGELASRFFAAARTGDLAGLESLLAHDVELVGDGGGKAPSLARSQRGRSRVAHTLTNWLRALRRLPEMEIRLAEVNGGPGATFLAEGRLLAVWALDVRDGQVAGVRAIVNPDKLAHLGPVGDANALIRRLAGSRPGD